MHTTYDERRDRVREMLSECLKEAKDLLDEDTWGYEEMREDYGIDVFLAIKKARDMV